MNCAHCHLEITPNPGSPVYTYRHVIGGWIHCAYANGYDSPTVEYPWDWHATPPAGTVPVPIPAPVPKKTRKARKPRPKVAIVEDSYPRKMRI